ncbi:hypothetical protein KIN20_029099 [Parelaphostrongylus tenuis]|uniref:Cyanovirin-N domain-containing protein n=1 Tax=Parelaphostrongylus tenuis TaxID=148309 RepID=A0AAD5WFB9_PARTN|nr:hypothetical protein KIN20_029099 [Parelaphostrongylus tenuis]
MKPIIALCVTVAAASYNSAPSVSPSQGLPAPYVAPYGPFSYGKHSVYPTPYHYPRRRYDSYHRPRSGKYYDCPYYDDYDESYTESKRCSRCMKLSVVQSPTPASIRYNTLSNGCLQAIISCPKTGQLFYHNYVQGNGRDTILAVGSGGSVVAQCRSDKKWHASSLDFGDVMVAKIDCVPTGWRLQDVIRGINERPRDSTEGRDIGFAERRFRIFNKI